MIDDDYLSLLNLCYTDITPLRYRDKYDDIQRLWVDNVYYALLDTRNNYISKAIYNIHTEVTKSQLHLFFEYIPNSNAAQHAISILVYSERLAKEIFKVTSDLVECDVLEGNIVIYIGNTRTLFGELVIYNAEKDKLYRFYDSAVSVIRSINKEFKNELVVYNEANTKVEVIKGSVKMSMAEALSRYYTDIKEGKNGYTVLNKRRQRVFLNKLGGLASAVYTRE